MKHNLTETQSYLFSRLDNATNRMGTLIDDILAYSHVSKGVDHSEEIDLNIKVQNVLGDLELEIQERAAKIIVGQLPGCKRTQAPNATALAKPD